MITLLLSIIFGLDHSITCMPLLLTCLLGSWTEEENHFLGGSLQNERMSSEGKFQLLWPRLKFKSYAGKGKQRDAVGHHLVQKLVQRCQFTSHQISCFMCPSRKNGLMTARVSIPKCLFWTTATKVARRHTLEIRKTYCLLCNHYACAN